MVQKLMMEAPWERFGAVRIPGTGMRVAAVDLTPAIAEEFLQLLDPAQRTCPAKRVQLFSGIAERRAFVLTHQGICFGSDGTLIDGQTRCRGVLSAGVPIRVLCFWNDVGEVKTPIDANLRPRTVGFVANISDREASVIRALKMLESGSPGMGSIPLSADEVGPVSERISDVLDKVEKAGPRRHFVAGEVAALIYAYPLWPDGVLNFASRVVTGEMLGKHDPALRYREWRLKGPKHKESWSVAVTMMSMINAHLDGKTMAAVFEGAETGYKKITARRRAERIAFTPGTDRVSFGE